ncbi:MAG: DUF6498-containing protein [Candidatus Buchananbacteria bacterium]|nr:DUF6498-containing protein [Candidatus Buchananbacteria bacterium]
MTFFKNTYNQLSTISWPAAYLLIVNLVPIFGVAFFDWSLYQILLAYWLENIVIGFYAILKIAKASGGFMFSPGSGQSGNLFKLFIIPFFIVHFGGFTLGHGLFIYALFGPNGFFPSTAITIAPLLIIFGLFMVSHGVSFWQNYIKNEEFRQVSPLEMMHAPYSRIIVMHLTVMGGAFAFSFLGLNSLSRVIIILIKTYFDYKLHLRQHRKLGLNII